MSENPVDPSGNTEAFRAFNRPAPEAKAPSKVPYFISGAVAVVLIALVAWLVF